MSGLSEEKIGIWWDLSNKFCRNLEQALTRESDLMLKVETKARAIPVVAKILTETRTLTDWQQDALCMFDEVFADITCAIYLSACALDKPAQTVLRRALEIGVATVYLWDLPHVYWCWKEQDRDLTFNEMIEHISNPGLKSLVRKQNSTFAGDELFDTSSARAIYRKLSNIVHGKISSFESTLPDKFKHNEDDWRSQLATISEVEDILLQLWCNRFYCMSERLESEFPPLRMNREQGE